MKTRRLGNSPLPRGSTSARLKPELQTRRVPGPNSRPLWRSPLSMNQGGALDPTAASRPRLEFCVAVAEGRMSGKAPEDCRNLARRIHVKAAPRPAEPAQPLEPRQPACPLSDVEGRPFWHHRTRAPVKVILPLQGFRDKMSCKYSRIVRIECRRLCLTMPDLQVASPSGL
jgi:hypothetical protein